jgi:SAM-dependent methyltransferase
VSAADFPAEFFDREDEGDDADFYAQPRFVVHIDTPTIAALTQAYRELLPPSGAVLDLMSSWVSHLPAEMRFTDVCGLGMNTLELAQNPRLTRCVVQDLNQQPELPFEDASFDAVINAVSLQYLTQPVAVLRSCARVLRPGGIHVIALSHRCFPTKAIRAWHLIPPPQRVHLVRAYFERAGGYDATSVWDRSPEEADPLWLIWARRAGSSPSPT